MTRNTRAGRVVALDQLPPEARNYRLLAAYNARSVLQRRPVDTDSAVRHLALAGVEQSPWLRDIRRVYQELGIRPKPLNGMDFRDPWEEEWRPAAKLPGWGTLRGPVELTVARDGTDRSVILFGTISSHTRIRVAGWEPDVGAVGVRKEELLEAHSAADRKWALRFREAAPRPGLYQACPTCPASRRPGWVNPPSVMECPDCVAEKGKRLRTRSLWLV